MCYSKFLLIIENENFIIHRITRNVGNVLYICFVEQKKKNSLANKKLSNIERKQKFCVNIVAQKPQFLYLKCVSSGISVHK